MYNIFIKYKGKPEKKIIFASLDAARDYAIKSSLEALQEGICDEKINYEVAAVLASQVKDRLAESNSLKFDKINYDLRIEKEN